jgi:hypothetical protein
MQDSELSFVIPTLRLRDAGETVEQYDGIRPANPGMRLAHIRLKSGIGSGAGGRPRGEPFVGKQFL